MRNHRHYTFEILRGFTKLLPPSLRRILCALYCSFSKCLSGIDLGIAYATWCAGGIVATSVISWILFGQKLTGIGILGIVLIVAGCVLVNLFGTPHKKIRR